MLAQWPRRATGTSAQADDCCAHRPAIRTPRSRRRAVHRRRAPSAGTRDMRSTLAFATVSGGPTGPSRVQSWARISAPSASSASQLTTARRSSSSTTSTRPGIATRGDLERRREPPARVRRECEADARLVRRREPRDGHRSSVRGDRRTVDRAGVDRPAVLVHGDRPRTSPQRRGARARCRGSRPRCDPGTRPPVRRRSSRRLSGSSRTPARRARRRCRARCARRRCSALRSVIAPPAPPSWSWPPRVLRPSSQTACRTSRLASSETKPCSVAVPSS